MRISEMEWIRKNKAFRVVCVIELLIIVWITAQCLRGARNLSFETADLIPADDAVVLAGSDDNSCYEITGEEETDGLTILTTDTFKLYPGAYNITIHYASDSVADTEAGFAGRTGSLQLVSEHHGVYFNFNSLSLRDVYTEESQIVQIKSPAALDDLCLTVTFEGGGTLDIYSVEITEICAWKYLMLLICVILFLLADLMIINFLRDIFGITEGILCLICAAAVIPFIADYSFSGHDIGFHLNRIVCLADELKQGNYFPAIYSTALNGYGYANPLFYGQFFLYIPAVLYACGFSLSMSYNIYIVIFSVAACLIMYGSAFKIFKQKKTALLAAALYTLSAVRLTNIFTRSAVGEFTAMTFLPLVVLGMYQIFSANPRKKIRLNQYLPLVIGLTGLVLSHVLTTVMCVMIILGFCVFNFRETLRPNRLLALCKSAILTFLINLSTLVPMADSMSMDLYINHSTNYIQNSGVYLIQLFNVIVNNYQEHNAVDTASNEMSLSIGFSVTLGLILFVLCLCCRKKDRENRTVFRFALNCFIITCVTLFLATKFMPYDMLAFLPDSIYSLLTCYQFPWRWLVFATLFGVYCTAYAVGAIGRTTLQKYRYTTVIAFSGVVAVLLLNMGQIYSDQLSTSKLQKYDNNSYSYTMSIGTGEYMLYEEGVLPEEESLYNYVSLTYNADTVYACDYERDGTTAVFYVENESESAEPVVLPMICYDNYYAYDENGGMLTISKDVHNRISVEIPAGYEGTVTVVYHIRNLWRTAILLSVLTVAALVWYSIRRRNIRRKNTGRTKTLYRITESKKKKE